VVFPHRLRARGLANHQPMGVERGSSNLGIASIQLPCARPNSLLRRLRLILSLDHPNQHTFPTDLRSGHANHTPQALPEPNSLYKLMERCAGKLGTPSMHKNVDRSAMAQCGCCMPRASVIAARVRYAREVRESGTTIKPRRGGFVLWPLDGSPPEPAVPPALPPSAHPILWKDGSRCQTRREWMTLLRTQTVMITSVPAAASAEANATKSSPFTRRQRAHWRLDWTERLARNARSAAASSLEVMVFGVPRTFAVSLGLPIT